MKWLTGSHGRGLKHSHKFLVVGWVLPIAGMNYEHADYLDTDDRGRVTLGKEFADTTMVVAWAEVGNPDPDHLVEPSEKEKEILGDLYWWARDNGYEAIDFDPHHGEIYTTSAKWVDTDVTGLKEAQADE